MSRPAKYQTVKELEEAIEEYFAENPESPTQSGLALHLGFASRQSLFDYKKKEEFSYTIKRAFMQIDEKHEQRLYENSNSGSIFYLKNRGWTDQLNITGKVSLFEALTEQPNESDSETG